MISLALVSCALTLPSRWLCPPQSRLAQPRCQQRDAAGFLAEDELGEWTTLEKSSDLGASKVTLGDSATALLAKLRSGAEEVIDFAEVQEILDAEFDATPVSFEVGDVINESG